ncbi:glycosyltransferase family 4 protein [Aerococcus viridans]|uniref:glycosyltransferase family 4 protein n=1 Tax=Aerococcus viridans TaxID=1377 RepID=UPI003B20D19E
MKNKDVVFLCQFFYPEYITSALLPYQTARYLAEKGMKVSAVCGYPREYLSNNKKTIPVSEEVDGIHILRVRYIQLKRDSMVKRMINYFSFVLMMFSKLFEIGRHKVIVVYSNPPILPIIALIAKWLFHSKIIFVSYDIYPEIAIKTGIIKTESISTTFMKWINMKLFSEADLIVALSNEMKNKIINIRDCDPDRISVIENWATEENEVGRDVSISSSDSYIKESITITYLGNMGIPQDLDTIIGAITDSRIKNNPLIKFVFAGHGNQKEKLIDAVKAHKINNVKVHDYLVGNAYKKVVDDTDIFLLSLKNELAGLAVPSKFYTYVMMNKYILSIINSDTDIARNSTKLEIGTSIDNGDIDSLVKIILYLTKNPDELRLPKDTYNKYFSKKVQLPKYYDEITKLLN